MNKRLNRILIYFSFLFILTSAILLENSTGSIFKNLDIVNYLAFLFILLMVVFVYVLLLYLIYRDIFHPIEGMDDFNINEQHYLIMTLMNTIFSVSLIIISKYSNHVNEFTKILPLYNTIYLSFIILSYYILLFYLIDAWKHDRLHSYDIKVVFLYMAIFGYFIVAIPFSFYFLYKGGDSPLDLLLITLMLVNALAILILQRNPSTVFFYLLGANFRGDEKKKYSELPASEKKVIIENKITKKVLIGSGLVNSFIILYGISFFNLIFLDF